MAKLTIFVITLVLIFNSVLAINKTVCDCSRPQTKGLLDLDEPPYCKQNKTNLQLDAVDKTYYKIMTKTRPDISWPAYSCSQWIETKTITGSFWIGSFDTVYSTTTKEVEPLECWKMVKTLQCGGNTMVHNGNTLAYTKKPVGDGYWYSVTRYSTLNCIAYEIKLRQEGSEDIISPFGILHTNTKL